MLLGLLMPLFLVAALGCVLARTGWLREGWQQGLGDVTAKVLLPAFLFSGAYRNGLPEAVSWKVMTAFYLPLVMVFAFAAWVLRREPASALAATYSNNVFVGVPVLMAAFGADSLQYAFPVIAFHTLLTFMLYFLAQGGKHVGLLLLSAVSNPIVVSLMLGLAANMLGLALPVALEGALGMLAATALPCALLVLGASLARMQVRSWSAGLAVAVVKLGILPACVLACGTFLGVPPAALAVLVVMSACPVGVNAGVLVQAEGVNPTVVNSAILLSSVACVVTIPLWIAAVR